MEKYLIGPKETIRNALKIMDKSATKTLFVHINKKLIGSLSAGDIRRAILVNMSLEKPVNNIMNVKPCAFVHPLDTQKIRHEFVKNKYESIPVTDHNGIILEIILWNKFFSEEETSFTPIDYPVIIMAGGKGTRMQPFTQIFPKPLVPIGEKTIIEVIMDEFKKYRINDFYVTVNYKKELLKAFFCDNDEYNITFIEENRYLGTAGSLKLLNNRLRTPFFVANCDILIKFDYADIVEFHLKGNFDLTLVASMKHYQIPYGICEIENGGNLARIDEKPQYDFLVNTGFYLLNPEVVDLIPDEKLFHMTHLMDKLKNKGKRIGVFPVSEKSWIDIGQWNEYRESLKLFNN